MPRPIHVLVAIALVFTGLFGGPAALARTLAVLDFETHADDPALSVLGPGVADMLRTDLVRSGKVTVVERDRIDAVRQELALQQDAAVDPATAAQLGKLVGAEEVVLGAVHANGDQIRIDARFVTVETGIATDAETVSGPNTQLFALEHQLAKQLVPDADWPEPKPADMVNASGLMQLWTSVWSDEPGGEPTIERRPANPAPPVEKKPCKRVAVEADKISGNTVKTADLPLGSVRQDPEGTVLTLRIAMMKGFSVNTATSDPAIHSGGSIPVELLLTDGTLVTLYSYGMPTAEARVGGGMAVTFRLNEAVMQAFASAGPELIRFKLKKQDDDYDISSKAAEKEWRPVFSCLLLD
jgi:TolB-like protein